MRLCWNSYIFQTDLLSSEIRIQGYYASFKCLKFRVFKKDILGPKKSRIGHWCWKSLWFLSVVVPKNQITCLMFLWCDFREVEVEMWQSQCSWNDSVLEYLFLWQYLFHVAFIASCFAITVSVEGHRVLQQVPIFLVFLVLKGPEKVLKF